MRSRSVHRLKHVDLPELAFELARSVINIALLRS